MNYPDIHDFHPEHPEISSFFEKSNLVGDAVAAPSITSYSIHEIDFSSVENQENIWSCTTNARVGLRILSEKIKKKVSWHVQTVSV